MHIRIMHSRLEPREEGIAVHPMSANIDGVDVQIAGYTIEPSESGPAVSLILLPDSLEYGGPASPASTPASAPTTLSAMERAPRLRTWGDPSIPDPREHLGLQVARNAEVSE
jgi:hypothetical protein